MNLKSLLASLALTHTVSAHYIWTTLVTPSGQSRAAVRQPVNNTPVELNAINSAAMRCNVNPGQASETVTVSAGARVGFLLDNQLYHQGPAALYLGKAPGSAASWDGSGANWFKIAEWGATFNPFQFVTYQASELYANIPSSTPSGEYLLRIEQIGLHVAGAPQYYISCAQINVVSGGSGNPSMVSIPGYVTGNEPGLTALNIYYPIPTSYTVPGPAVWRG